MTRETKIGLLVGLAFIIVIGILLSDYNRNESQSASLTAVATDVQRGAATPHNGSTDTAILPPPPAPARPVPTHDELHPPAAPRSPAANNHDAVRPVVARPPVIAIPPVPETTDDSPAPDPGLTPDMQRLVNEHRTDLAPAGPAPRPAAPANPPTVNGARQYVAVAGDTVSKLAGRFLGANTRPNRDAIIAINASLKQNPNNVIVGKTYMIPPKSSAGGAVPSNAVAAAPVKPAPAAESHYGYVVKENDSLWKIAAEQLGDGNAWESIKELNKDILKGGETVRPNMHLRLPAKPIASAN